MSYLDISLGDLFSYQGLESSNDNHAVRLAASQLLDFIAYNRLSQEYPEFVRVVEIKAEGEIMPYLSKLFMCQYELPVFLIFDHRSGLTGPKQDKTKRAPEYIYLPRTRRVIRRIGHSPSDPSEFMTVKNWTGTQLQPIMRELNQPFISYLAAEEFEPKKVVHG